MTTRSVQAIALSATLVAGVASARRAPPSQPAPTASPPEASVLAPAQAAGKAMGPEALVLAADEITRQVAALRGLEAKRPVERGVLSRDEIGAKLRERIGKEYTPEEIRVEARVLKRLGLLPPEADYEKLLLDLLMEQVAGFYDPFARRLYIADWLGLDLQRPTLAHEIEHALQDQHFDLRPFATPIKDDGDRQTARSALVEGDGTAVMLAFVAQQLGLDTSRSPDLMGTLGRKLAAGLAGGSPNQSPVFTRAPRFLRETMLFPYFAGLGFVLALTHPAAGEGHGPAWARVDAAFRDPPESTEQVMHPEKYLAHEHPVAVSDAPLASLSPWTALRRDVLGELEWKVLLATQMADGEAERAAAGWGGDRLVAYGPAEAGAAAGADPEVAVVDLSAWDTEQDAIEAESALRTLLQRQLHEGTEAEPHPAHAARTRPHPAAKPLAPARYTAGANTWSVERRGSAVLALFGVPSEKHDAVVAETWKSWKVGAAAK